MFRKKQFEQNVNTTIEKIIEMAAHIYMTKLSQPDAPSAEVLRQESLKEAIDFALMLGKYRFDVRRAVFEGAPLSKDDSIERMAQYTIDLVTLLGSK